MKSTLTGLAGNVLFALTILLLFLLLFEDKLVVPPWLQAVGRMHPLLLHFPIAILLLSMFLEFFRFKAPYSQQEFFQTFASRLLLVGVLSAAVTAIMGLLLAREEGYAGQVLQWHKWTGAGIVFVAALVYWCRNYSWYRAPVAQAGALVTSLCLVSAGHFGATLTHGDNFILAPITTAEVAAVPLEQALVYDHVIRPILEQKCIGCHNPDKAKGGLMLSDPGSLLKGGKTGAALVPGKPEVSLVLERVHLPLEEKKHMPPKSKVQLTRNEITLLHLWIKNRADFTKKVVDLPATDSLRVLASAALQPAGRPEPQFTFAAADAHTIEQLNTEYRVIAPLAKESPALAVTIYNRAAFTAQTVEELRALRTQIVSLDLNNMPVTDAHLKTIRQFENLRKLNLNFTEIAGKGLPELASLPHLQSLSVAGTKITYPALQEQINSFKSLTTLTLWNTALTDLQIGELQKNNPHIRFNAGFRNVGANPIRLNTPQVKNKTTIFGESIPLQLYHPIKGVTIRYTTDGSEPDSIHAPPFTREVLLKENTTVKARAYKAGWLSSETATFHFYRNAYRPDSVILLTRLDRVHQADGPHTFFDKQLGSFNANSPAWANYWAGYFRNDMEVLLEFRKPKTVSSVALNTLIETETIIFPPYFIEIWGGNAQDHLRLLATVKPDLPRQESKPFIRLISCSFKPSGVSYLKIVAKPVSKLPAWHKNKGQPAMLLVDELLVN